MSLLFLTLIKIFLYNKELLRKLMKIKTCCLSKINLMKKEKKIVINIIIFLFFWGYRYSNLY